MEGVALVRGRGQATFQQHGNETVDSNGRVLRGEIEFPILRERFSQNHDSVNVSLDQTLEGREEGREREGGCECVC